MTTDQPTLTVDFRDGDFKTMRQLETLPTVMLEDFADEMPHARVGKIIISQSQLKLLRFDWYMSGTPERICKKRIVSRVNGVDITVSAFEEGCANCGDVGHF